MARDGFSKATIERLAKRVGMKCSFPDCRRPTAGPDAAEGVTNIGVAAHITAASLGGPRYDSSLSYDERSDIKNGIWLCQNHAKLIDDDELSYPSSRLRDWKETAEDMAALEAKGFSIHRASPFPDLEKKAPKLIAEMRDDLNDSPLIRQLVLLNKNYSYNLKSTPSFSYFYEDHEYLDSVIIIMLHCGAVYDVTVGKVSRYNFTEEFVRYLIGDS